MKLQKIIDAPIGLLLPTEGELLRRDVEKYFEMTTKPPAILVVRCGGKLIIGDGNYRAYVAHLKNEPTIRAIVVRSFLSFGKYGNHGALSHVRSIREFRRKYEKEWSKTFERAGIFSVSDARVVEKLKTVL